MDSEPYWMTFWERKLTRRRFGATAAAGTGLTTAFLVACSSKSSGGGNSAGTKPGGAAPQASAPAAQIKRGGTTRLVFAAQDPVNLNPTKGAIQAITHSGFVYGRLFKFHVDANPQTYASYTLEPDLALKTEQLDPTTAVFHLRPNVKFHDGAPTNGRAFGAADVKYHFDAYKQSGARKSDLRAVASIEATDPLTVTFKLTEPRSDFIPYTAYPSTSYIVPREQWENEALYDTAARGTGPFVFDHWDKGSGIFYKKNPSYYDAALPNVDAVQALIIGDNRTIVARMRAGEVDWAYNLLTPPEVESAGLKRKIYAPDASGVTLGFDGKPPFTDPRVRQAIQLSIDRDGLIKSLLQGKGQVTGPMLSGAMTPVWGLPANDPTWQQWVKYDPKQAKDLLAAAGVSNLSVEFNLTNGYGQAFLTQGQAIAAELNAIGINTDIKVLEYADYIANVLRGPRGYKGILYAQITAFTDPSNYFETYLDVQNSPYNFRTDDKQAFDLYTKQRSILDPQQRKSVIQDLLRRVVEQALFPPLPQSYQGTPVQDHVQNFLYSGTFSFGTETAAQYWLQDA